MHDQSEIVERLAPCGLDCRRCYGYSGGSIKENSTQLLESLSGLEKVAGMLEGVIPAFKGYPQFKEMLEFLAGGSCPGCRQGGSKFPLCSARTCFKEKGVDFCFQCDQYPCDRNRYHPPLRKKWLDNNNRMKEIGIEAFYQEQLGKTRY